MDIHGWAELSLGNGEMAQVFAEPFGLKLRRLGGGGMVGSWLNSATTEGMLLELPRNPDKDAYVTRTAKGLVEGINAWIDVCSQ